MTHSVAVEHEYARQQTQTQAEEVECCKAHLHCSAVAEHGPVVANYRRHLARDRRMIKVSQCRVRDRVRRTCNLTVGLCLRTDTLPSSQAATTKAPSASNPTSLMTPRSAGN